VKVEIEDGVRLWFDVEGLGLVPDGDAMRERATILLLHGGPGMDHSLFKPGFSTLADVGQVVYYDHRGQGRSDRRTPTSGRSTPGPTTSCGCAMRSGSSIPS
jgi:proline iminopeptidase